MSQSEPETPDLLDVITAATHRARSLISEVERLRAMEEWALSVLPVKDGDAVVIKDCFPPIPQTSGWYPHRGHLVPGATGVVTSLHFVATARHWIAMYQPDVEWTLYDHEGEQQIEIAQPEWRHTFAMRMCALRVRTEADVPLTPPEVGTLAIPRTLSRVTSWPESQPQTEIGVAWQPS